MKTYHFIFALSYVASFIGTFRLMKHNIKRDFKKWEWNDVILSVIFASWWFVGLLIAWIVWALNEDFSFKTKPPKWL